MKNVWKLFLLILSTAFLISTFLFDINGTILSYLISIIPASIFLILFFINRNIYWWTFPMDIITLIAFAAAIYVYVKYENINLLISIFLTAFLSYFFINYILHIYKYPWFKTKEDKLK